LLDAAALTFIFGTIVGLLSPFYLAVTRFTFLYLFLSALPLFLLETVAYFASAILCLICYRNLRRGRLRLASIRGVIAAGLLGVTGAWVAGLLVLGAAVTCSLYQEL